MIKLNVLAILSITISAVVHAGDLAQVVLSDTPTPLLADRLCVRMPQGSKIEARAGSIMAAEESPEEETRVVFDLNNNRLVLMVYETFTTAPNDFAAEVRRMDQEASQNGQTVKSELIIDREDFRVFQRTPTSVDTNHEAILIMSAWVVNADKTIQLLRAYANPTAASELQDVQKLYSEVLRTLEPGKKRLSIDPSNQNLDVYSDEKALMVKLPKGWVHTIQRGPDYLVHSLRKVSLFGDDAPSVGVYLGGHPSYHHRRGEAKPVKTEGSLILGKTDWFKVSNEGSIFAESMRPAKELNDTLIFHVWLSAPSEEVFADVEKIVDSMRLIDRQKAETTREQTPGGDVQKAALQE